MTVILCLGHLCLNERGHPAHITQLGVVRHLVYLTHGAARLLRDARIRQLLASRRLVLVLWEDTLTHVREQEVDGVKRWAVDAYQHQVMWLQQAC